MGDRKPVQKKKTSGKQPVIGPNSVLGNKLRFRFNHIDVDSEWCLSNVTPADHKNLLKKLKEFEEMKVGEIFTGSPGKDYDSVKNPDANKRLFQLFGGTEVSRLRVSSKGRLYGIRENDTFSILWRDPNHGIYPVNKE